jgi:hypothetical protein
LPAAFLGAPAATIAHSSSSVRGWARDGGPGRARTCGTGAATQVCKEVVLLLALLSNDAGTP